MSTISLSTSIDLVSWSAPRTLVKPTMDYMRDPALGDAVSNPRVFEAGTGGNSEGTPEWRLYFSASLSWIDDCGFNEPRYIALARGPSPGGPFAPDGAPVNRPEVGTATVGKLPDGAVAENLGAGSIKVIRMDDGWIGLQNRIYRDFGGRSRSAIFMVRSGDGLSWHPVREEALVAPGEGWTHSHVYACDCRYRQADGLWYLYFNARDGWTIADGTERMGRIVSTPQ